MATILTKRSNTASSVPLAADLTNSTSGAELAVNTADKRVYTKDSGGSVVELGTNPSSLALPNGTANGVPYLNGSKVLTTGSALTFDGTNLGLGVTPSAWFFASKVFENEAGSLSSYGTAQQHLAQNAYLNSSSVWTYKNNASAVRYEQGAASHSWYTAPSGTAGNAISFTQAMTLDASGNLLVGKTTTNIGTAGTTVLSTGEVWVTRDASPSLSLNRLTNDGTQILFHRSGTQVGSVSVTTTATAYNTSSDYRLKNTIAPMTGALAKVALLKPCTYKWNADGSDGEGFIAHELAEVCPAAVTGEKDAVDAEGKPIYQGIDVSFLVGTLTAAIQELKAEFDAYKASHP
jgi:Chaperone of endosialidase